MPDRPHEKASQFLGNTIANRGGNSRRSGKIHIYTKLWDQVGSCHTILFSSHPSSVYSVCARRIFPGVMARHDSGASKQNKMQITKENGFARDCLPDAVSPSFCGSGQSVSNTRTPRIDRPWTFFLKCSGKQKSFPHKKKNKLSNTVANKHTKIHSFSVTLFALGGLRLFLFCCK